jgi:lysophospholipase L1-like esterase
MTRQTTRQTTRLGVVALGLAAVAALASCGDLAQATSTGPSIAPTDELYVSIGDSYAAGYRPAAAQEDGDRSGFAYVVADRLAADGRPVKLVNFGCSGTTSDGVLRSPGCDPAALGPDATPYPGTPQVDAAEAFLRQHRDRVRLITVVVGGNDVQKCLKIPGRRRIEGDSECVKRATATLGTNLARIAAGIRAAAGDGVPVVGLTYPDVYLATALSGTPQDDSLAQATIVMFRDQVNPVLRRAYAAAGASFVDVTDATGAYRPFSETAVSVPYGEIPVPIAEVCRLTYACSLDDVHPTPAGHALIAELVLHALDRSTTTTITSSPPTRPTPPGASS